jgi:hypothetical protein
MKVLEEHITSIFRVEMNPEDGDSKFLQKVCNHLQDFKAP